MSRGVVWSRELGTVGGSGDVGLKPRTEYYLYLGAEPGRVQIEFARFEEAVDVGHFGARTCYVRVLERALVRPVV